MFNIRQGATHKVVIGPVVAVGDGFTPVTTLDVATADEAEVILHNNATVVDISGYTWAAIVTADGYYHLTLHADISGTVGHMTVVINDDNLCLPVRADFTVVEEAVYDALYAADAVGPNTTTPPTAVEIRTEIDSNSTQLGLIVGDTDELQTNQGNWVTATGFSTHSAADVVTALGTGSTLTACVTATGFSTHSAADAADAVWNELSAGHTDAGKAGQQLWTDLDAVLADTNELQADWANDGRLDTILDAVSGGGSTNITTETTIIESE